jgi:D-cysteine desulfhydrase
VADLPLLRRFPALAVLPRARFGAYPTPVERVALDDGRTLLIKRDDRSGTAFGGNKVRGLEWLLGDVRPDERIVTVGPVGSTHALITAAYARPLGARVTVVRWNQEMNPASRRVAERIEAEANVIDARWVPAAYAVAGALRMRGARWIPAGGATPLAVLGQVNAALELAEQIESGECELPERLVVPLGTGGTAAGLALGLSIAGLGTQVVAVRVVPRVVGRIARVIGLANATASLIERVVGGGTRLPRLDNRRGAVRIEHSYYAGAYGRPIERDWRRGEDDALRSAGVRVDDTYSRKALAAALAQRDHLTLFWLTFDGRLLD